MRSEPSRAAEPASRSAPPPLLPSPTALGVSLAGLVLIALFVSLMAGTLFPIRLLDPAWQLRVGAALIDSSPLPLAALVLLHLGRWLDPGDALLSWRQRIAARLAVAVALGYLLLLPLLCTAALLQQQRQISAQSSRIAEASAQLGSLRQAVASASEVDALERSLRALKGPQLDAAERGLPLPLIKRRLEALLDQASAQVRREQSAMASANRWRVLPQILRTTLACLALFLGFAGLARRRDRELSWLMELQGQWETLQDQLGSRRPGRGSDRDASLRTLVDQMAEPQEPQP